jgi:hypothetical protein
MCVGKYLSLEIKEHQTNKQTNKQKPDKQIDRQTKNGLQGKTTHQHFLVVGRPSEQLFFIYFFPFLPKLFQTTFFLFLRWRSAPRDSTTTLMRLFSTFSEPLAREKPSHGHQGKQIGRICVQVLGNCLSTLGKKITEGHFFQRKMLRINFDKKWFGQHFRRFFHKLIWPPRCDLFCFWVHRTNM